MDFTLICSNIQELLIGNETVVIPEVGELRVEMEPAAFLQDGKTILPPKKKLVFEQCDAGAECEEWMKDLGKKIRESLVSEGKFEVYGLGVFTDKGEGKIEFSLNEEFDFAPDSFSLEAISLETVTPPNEKEADPEQDPEQESEPESEPEAESESEPEKEEVPAEKPSEKTVGEHVEKHVEEPVEKHVEEHVEKHVEEPVEKPAVAATVGKEECDVEHRRDCRRKWMMGILIVLVLMAVIALFVILFKDDIIQTIKGMLYTEEELEIMKKWAAQ